jgi:tRNA pseudouridine55 synthase
MDGVIVLDKPAGFTSHDAVQKARRILGMRRIGHLGTLDPLATGVLPLVVGRATRLAQFFRYRDKLYQGVMRLGFATDTYDRTGERVGEEQAVDVSREEIELVFREFTGRLQQVPPPVSAKKIGGVEAYKLARKHQPVELDAAPVEVMEFTLLDYQQPQVTFRVHCSGGTYVRSLVHDAGRRLACGAHVLELRRLASGEFTEEHARTPDQLAALAAEGRAAEALVPAEKLLPEFPAYKLPPAAVASVLHGRDFRTVPPLNAAHIKVLAPDGRLLAIADRGQMGFFHPAIVL